MSNFEDKFVKWADEQFSIKVPVKDVANLIQSKRNGPIWLKLLQFFEYHINSKKNGKLIKKYSDYVECCKEIESTEQEIDKVKAKIGHLSSSYAIEEKNYVKLKEKELQYNQVINTATNCLRVFEELTNQSKYNINFEPNISIINDAVDSYLKLFMEKDEILKTIIVKQEDVKNKVHCNRLIIEINTLMNCINTILYELNEFENESFINFDFDQTTLIKNLMMIHSKNDIDLNITEVEPEIVDIEKEELAKKVEELSIKYNKIRNEQLNKLKEKLTRVLTNFESVLHSQKHNS